MSWASLNKLFRFYLCYKDSFNNSEKPSENGNHDQQIKRFILVFLDQLLNYFV